MTTTEIGGAVITSSREQISTAGLKASATRIASPGTLLLAMYGQGKTRGKVAILGIAAAMNQACAAIEAGDRVDSRYLLHFLNSQYDAIRSLSNAGSQENLSGEIVRKIPILVPPLEEQHLISRLLDDAVSSEAVLEALIAKKQAIKQGMVQQLITGRTRLPGFTDSWQRITLGELGTFLKGRGVKRDDVRRSGIPCIRYGELYTDFANYTATTHSFVSREIAATAQPIRSGDLLFAGSGETREDIGRCVAYIGERSAVAGGDIVILRGGGFNPIYLAVLANSPVVAIQKARAGQGDAVVHISSRALGAIGVEIPTKPEQDAIASVVVDADREIEALRARLLKARAIKTGMMQQLLTGRTRLRVETTS